MGKNVYLFEIRWYLLEWVLNPHVVKIAKKSAIHRSIIERLTGRDIAIYRRFCYEISPIKSPKIGCTPHSLIEEIFIVRNVSNSI